MEHGWLDKKQTIEELCKIVSKVGEHFDHEYAHDCICGENQLSSADRVDTHIVEFIQQAVKEKINL